MASNVETKQQGKMKLFGGVRGVRGGRTWRPGMVQPAVPGRERRGPGEFTEVAFDEDMRMYGSGFDGHRTASGAEMMLAQAGTRMREEIPLPALTRVMVTVPDELDARQQEAIEEENLLGYAAYRKALGLPGPLARTLAALEIPHLDTESVVQYKYAMMSREHRKLNPDNNRRDLFFDMKSCSVPDLASANAEPTFFRSVFMAFDPVDTAGGMSLRRRESVTVVRWQCTPLRGYEVAVPDFARSKALQIARALAGVEFFVEELREDKVLIDPFLIAKLGDEQFYIEVWGEPEFESQMEHNQV